MFTVEQLRRLSEFRSSQHLLTSIYFRPPKPASRAHHEEAIAVKDLFQEARRQWELQKLEAAQADSLERDFRRALEYLATPEPGGRRPVALFSCAGEKFWEAVSLPRGIPSAVFLGETFYLQPLAALLDQYPRYCVVLLERDKARLFEIYMDQIEDRSQILDPVPPRMRGAGWGGFQERRIERHMEHAVQRHYQRVADQVRDLLKKYRFDALLLGGHREAFSDFENHLPAHLLQRLVGRFVLDPGTATPDEIRARALELIRERDHRQKQDLVRRVLDGAAERGLGVTGLEATLAALLRGQVRTLVVGEGLAVGGKRCQDCGALAVASDASCPQCRAPLRPVQDIVEHAVQFAIQEASQVRFINDHEEFRRAGNIGALLRFRLQAAS